MPGKARETHRREFVTEYDALVAGEPITQWLLCGPFVIRTPGAFEQEYMYEREIILDQDYLEGVGGEANVRPTEGDAVKNPGVGEKLLGWRAYQGDSMNFCGLTGELLYETVQRNAVWYCAAHIETRREEVALLDCHHSGMYAWVNGRKVVDQPYGPAKGLRVPMTPALVRLHSGGNLVLFSTGPDHILSPGDMTRGWGSKITGTCNVIAVPGDHSNLFDEPQLTVLIEKIRGALGAYHEHP